MESSLSEKSLVEHLQELYPDEDFTDWSLGDIPFAVGDALHALMYWKVFFPDFVEYKGMVFEPDTVAIPGLKQRLDELIAKEGIGPHIERAFNFMELVSLFNDRKRIATEEEEEEVLRLLTISWKLKLEHDFPDKRFVVSIVPEDGISQDVGIEFYQEIHVAT